MANLDTYKRVMGIIEKGNERGYLTDRQIKFCRNYLRGRAMSLIYDGYIRQWIVTGN